MSGLYDIVACDRCGAATDMTALVGHWSYALDGEDTVNVRSENVIVCKSMSKVYALSGARVAYLCAGPHQLEELRALTPPWVVSLPAQVAAVRALNDPAYYA